MGPAVDNEEKLRALMLAGMDAARFNFSHGTHESHLALLTKVNRTWPLARLMQAVAVEHAANS